MIKGLEKKKMQIAKLSVLSNYIKLLDTVDKCIKCWLRKSDFQYSLHCNSAGSRQVIVKLNTFLAVDILKQY